MRTPIRTLALLAATALPLGAQVLSDAAVITAPQFVSYRFGTGADEKTVSQFSMPFAVILPFSDRFNVDISSAFANSQVKATGAATSSINGLTDTQIRGNYTLGDNSAILTIGLNLPTGEYTVPTAQQAAAGQIGNDFLVYPVSSMGNGLAATGGVAFAQTVGETWNLGVGASFRHSTQFDAYRVDTAVLRFTPGDEYRLRVGLDHPVGDGQFSVGVTYSKFGSDAANSVSFSTGDRALAQSTLSLPWGDRDVQVGVWDLYRGSGQIFNGRSPWENVGNLSLAVGFHAGDVYVQPSAEGRSWNVGGDKAGTLGTLGVRFRFDAGPLSINPSAAYAFGTIYQIGGGPSQELTGWKGLLMVRLH